ncbi:radical SAM superfamily protein [Lyngbya aestuarii BL J]|uniref:Heme chaperone HemW n=1 Tax=Lyngbya aestuarii BL J TaxID=1348334 RepID=U7QQV1_9CYAN|nr:radical SAM family heme chaperone HemW [Lyngbya aestuarii]ERT09465.1 radical SAM superfamily protein [Lyngbya aestuarii BL J]
MVNSPIFSIPTSAYLHIPFCRRRCYYCDFAVSVVGDRKRGENSTWIQQYVDVLCEEITQAPVEDQPLETIFFGGGTPSLLSVSQLGQILDRLEQRFGIDAQAEISMEMDPDTFDLHRLQGFINLGINRVSLGVQAFQDELLQACGRSHTVADVWKAIDLIHAVGVSNYSLDLISGLPHQTLELWQQSVEQVLTLNPPHISHYDLIVEPKTVFGRYYSPGESPLPTDESTTAMYRWAQKILTQAGYTHYEISNYAQPGMQCRHNLVYWHCQPYYGFGMGAASYLQGYRLTRPRQTQLYHQWVHSEDQMQNAEWVNRACDQLLERLMLGLRLSEGLNLRSLSQQFGQQTVKDILHCLHPYQEQGWVEVVARDGEADMTISGSLRLTDPEGFLFSNTILASLFRYFTDSEISDQYS